MIGESAAVRIAAGIFAVIDWLERSAGQNWRMRLFNRTPPTPAVVAAPPVDAEKDRAEKLEAARLVVRDHAKPPELPFLQKSLGLKTAAPKQKELDLTLRRAIKADAHADIGILKLANADEFAKTSNKPGFQRAIDKLELGDSNKLETAELVLLPLIDELVARKNDNKNVAREISDVWFRSANCGSFSAIEKLIPHVDVNQRTGSDVLGSTALHIIAALSADKANRDKFPNIKFADIAKLLIANGAKPNLKQVDHAVGNLDGSYSYYGPTALQLSGELDNPVTTYLLDLKFPPVAVAGPAGPIASSSVRTATATTGHGTANEDEITPVDPRRPLLTSEERN